MTEEEREDQISDLLDLLYNARQELRGIEQELRDLGVEPEGIN